MRWPALLLSAVVLAGCGGGDEPGRATRVDPPGAGAEDARPDAAPEPRAATKPSTVRRAHCAPAAGNCTEVTGRVLYVEAVDPDGDGDAHYVLAGGRVTAPGISVVDVRRDLRPRRLPRRGELVSAAGPVFTGSYGQRQIEAVAVNHQRRR
jgi:hypothetical protein